MKLTTRPDLQPALAQFIRARDIRAKRVRQLAQYDELYGVGSHELHFVSGGFRNHWPAHAKAVIRVYVRKENEAREAGFSARPPRVRSSTMRALYQLVMK